MKTLSDKVRQLLLSDIRVILLKNDSDDRIRGCFRGKPNAFNHENLQIIMELIKIDIVFTEKDDYDYDTRINFAGFTNEN